jgi:hypothetical protein
MTTQMRMNENYEIKVGVHKLEQRTPSIPRLKHLRDHKNFDIEFSPSGKVLQVTNYTGALIVHSREYLLYDDQLTLALSVELDAAYRCKKITSLESFDKGVKTWITRTTLGQETNRAIELFDDGRLLSVKSFDGDGHLKIEKTFEYAENKLAKCDSNYYGIGGSLAECWISHYNSDGRIADTFGLKPNGEPLGDGRYKFEYDSEGRESKVWSFNEWDDVATSVKTYEYECDQRGNWIERRALNQSRSDSYWRTEITTRKLTYYPSPE